MDVNTDLWRWSDGDFDKDPNLVLDSVANLSQHIDLSGVPQAKTVCIKPQKQTYEDFFDFVISYK
ncbi:hypothetical protein [Catalinimonas niigatensis]|uniref:hypothetical protein n=1 Tax=Catalinimonas niigatensis TaxID=1397264 RepID=UPI002665425D|nr:hypothetical protein [Catalinimonas niigatensis]WPP49918.1 hypothetical protein PZB72_24940 [Catalinimonas niigatensis]